MKTNKMAKKDIIAALRTENSTLIFRAAKKYGIDISNYYGGVFNFIKEFAPTQKISRNAYKLSYGAKDKKYKCFKFGYNPILQAIIYAKENKRYKGTSYFKILIEGNRNIYWASPIYEHSDYNKSIAFENTPENRAKMDIINNFLNN